MKTQIKQLLANTKGVTFASVEYTSDIKTAAAFSSLHITKRIYANVQLFGTIKDFNVFANAVKRNTGVADYKTSETWFEHDKECFSIVTHKTKGNGYLYCIYNKVIDATYFVNGKQVEKQEIEQYLTPSALKVFKGDGTTYNATNDVTHDIICRTIALDSIDALKANKQVIVK